MHLATSLKVVDGARALENVEPGERLHIVGGNANECCLYRKQDEGLKQNEVKHGLKIGLSCNLEVPHHGSYPKEIETTCQKNRCTSTLLQLCSEEPRFRFGLSDK